MSLPDEIKKSERKTRLYMIGAVIASIVIAIILYSIFGGRTQKSIDSYSEAQIKAIDSLNKELKDIKENRKLDNLYQQARDSAMITEILKTRQVLKAINTTRDENITKINSLNRSELRKALRNLPRTIR